MGAVQRESTARSPSTSGFYREKRGQGRKNRANHPFYRSEKFADTSICRVGRDPSALALPGLAVILVHLPRSLPVVLPPAALLGGFMSTLYPVCVSHAHDRMPADRVVRLRACD